MINKKVLQNLSRKTGIPAETLEKDYVMNLILDAITHIEETQNDFFFKGGSCIHKCFSEHRFSKQKNGFNTYFSTGRFSGDIDLTVSAHFMKDKGERLVQTFKKIAKYVFEHHGLVLLVNDDSFPIHNNKHQLIHGRPKRNSRGIIRFQGPMYNPKFNAPALKIDVTADECVVFKPKARVIYNPYEPESTPLYAITYRLEDIFAEKIQALHQRCYPRDVFDLNTLYSNPEMDCGKYISFGQAIIKKFRLKGLNTDLNVENFNKPNPKTNKPLYEMCKESWETSLKKQISELGEFEDYWAKIPEILDFANKCITLSERIKHQYNSISFFNIIAVLTNTKKALFKRIPTSKKRKTPRILRTNYHD